MLKPLDVLGQYPAHGETLAGLLKSRSEMDGDRRLLSFEGREYSWTAFEREVLRASALLHELGVAKGDRVAIVATNSDAHIILLFAAARLGAAMVPLNPSYGAAELKYILPHADVKGVVGSVEALDLVRGVVSETGIDIWLLPIRAAAGDERDFFSAVAEDAPPAQGEPGDTCLIIYTSGTTGLPKGVMHDQRNYVACAEVAAGRTGLQPDDRVLVLLPFFHVNALFYSIGSIFAAGASGTLLPRFSASTFWDSVVSAQATQVNIIEAVGNILQKRPRSEFRPEHKLRVVYGVREAFAKTFREDFKVPYLVTGFGMTECPGVICNELEGQRRPGSIGVLGTHPDKSRQWTQARIVDDEGRALPDGETGELWLKSPTLMKGYFRDSEHTAAAYRDGWFMTGDLVRRDPDGFYYFVSRKKDIIRRRGENISGAELDRVIGEHPGVYEAAAIAVPAELGEDEILVAVIRREGSTVSAAEIADWCRGRLAPMKVPRYVAFVDTLPHTPTHKVSKTALRADQTLRGLATDLEKQPETT